ncbi:uncharacterized protein MONBRDRAFT_16817 [Monosiga brevicollis MX1]|uniref:AP complex subunit beta n=1 Tax=Monosiga brevicollis TaxID=81824 RepID=A9UXU6_MONBE|nr:uncharacterized protein MONBRDRAFT_16817 [Monosiga brevicollis MX1]EDQ89747.1 predicted protein [Monosiga brevicollis MX1]|eukprot:XP_001745169.1 hypothetical protein [Monosiga brevicollis MX1]
MATKGYENKRSEVNELRTLLRNPEVQRDPQRYCEVVEKVTLYQTLGLDVSSLFSDMVLACATRSLVQKKLVYLYLCNYAQSNSDLTLLTINTLQKDCRDTNPMIRGLALRSMCGLRVPNLVEYVLVPLKDGLADKSPYVRQTAVMGCVKLFYLDQSYVTDNNLAESLHAMIHDRDAQVVANAVIALEEVLAARGGIMLTQEVAYMLFNRLREFTEWKQCAVMNVLLRYKPASDDEVFSILNIVDERLKHSNTGVVLGAARLFLHFTAEMEDIQEDIYERLKTPLITLMSSAPAEVSFSVLHHLHTLVKKRPDVLAKDFKAFFCRFSDPAYVKTKKLDVLVDVAMESNFEPIVEEMTAYVTDIDVERARHAVRCVGRIAVKVPAAAEHCTTLLAFLELNSEYVTAETVIVMRDYLRHSPSDAVDLLPQLFELISPDLFDDESDARAAFAWLLGEFGELIEDAPYLLEAMVDDVEAEETAAVRLQLLNSTLKLFFKRPPECQKMLGRLLETLTSDEIQQDVHDRALLYYRLLRSNPDEARRVINATLPPILDHDRSAMTDMELREFNTLSVIYGQPSINFTVQQPPYCTFGTIDPTAALKQAQQANDEDEDEEEEADDTPSFTQR